MKTLARDELYERYVMRKEPMHKIGEDLNVSPATVLKYLNLYGIPSRDRHKGFLGKHHTHEVKEKISKAHKGKTVSQETRDKVSNAKKLKTSGHKKSRKDGYIYVYYPNHPKATRGGYIMEHHLVMEQFIGRPIKDEEVVHHKNHKRDDNRIENLELMTFKEHASLHMKERWEQKRRNDLSIR